MLACGMKRSRDDSDDEFSQPEGKRPRALPLRESPTTRLATLSFSLRHLSKPPSLAPADGSSSDDSSPSPIFASPPLYPQRSALPAFVATDVDADMDCAMDDVEGTGLGSPVWSPKAPALGLLGPSPSRLAPSPSYTPLLSSEHPLNITNARAPTPILGSFPARARGGPFAGTSGPNSLSPIPAPGSSAAADQLALHDPLRRRHPLPSPISEDTASPTAMMRDLDMAGSPAAPSFVIPRRSDSSGSSASTSSDTAVGRRRRSDAISGGGGSGGGKVVFSMGFRADCEKCREKVPGHYSHVLRM